MVDKLRKDKTITCTVSMTNCQLNVIKNWLWSLGYSIHNSFSNNLADFGLSLATYLQEVILHRSRGHVIGNVLPEDVKYTLRPSSSCQD